MSLRIANAPRTRRIAPIRTPKQIEAEKRAVLQSMMAPMVSGITGSLGLLGENPNPRYALNMLKGLRVQWGAMFGSQADRLAQQWSQEVSVESKRRLQKSLSQAIGIDMGIILDDPAVSDSVLISAEEAASLIRGIPENYIGRISQAVVQSIRKQPFSDDRTLAQEIQHIGALTKDQARVIARDQTSKMNATINQVRQTSVGIEEYIWRTSEDNRVVGKPGGLYPKGSSVHGNHFDRNGKLFKWAEPPADGHPGWPIGCRCNAIPVIDRRLLRLTTAGYRLH